MSKQDLSVLKSVFNNRQTIDAFKNVLSDKQAIIVTKLLSAKTIDEVKQYQGAWFELEKLKGIHEQIVGAEKNGN